MQIDSSKAHKIFIIAGEASGDTLGAKLIASLRKINPKLNILAIGGDCMQSNGAEILFHYNDIAVMGFIETLPSLFKIIGLINKTVKEIQAFNPDILISIDSPGFNFRVVSKLRKQIKNSIPIIHYVSPTIWAYKENRIQTVKKLYDHILLLLPFEKAYYDKALIPNTYVGHPLIEDITINAAKLSSAPNPVLLIMPGSRKQELVYMGNIFKQAIEILINQYKINPKIIIFTKSNLKAQVQEMYSDILEVLIICDEKLKTQYIKTVNLALVKSGTSSLEMAIHKIPCVVGYKMSALSYFIIKSMIKIKYISLVNIMLNHLAIPELIQNKCTPENLAYELYNIYSDKSAQKMMNNKYSEVINLLQNDADISPSDLAAKTVFNLIYKH